MQKHAFLCQRNCIYVNVTTKVYDIGSQNESVVDIPVDIGVSVLADMYNWHRLVCVCDVPFTQFSLVWNLFLWPYIASVEFPFDNRFVCRNV